MRRTLPLLLLFALMFSSCATQGATKTEQTAIANSIMQQIEIKQTDAAFALTPTITPTASQTPTITLTPSPTSTATPTITPTWIKHPKGTPIIAPILLYHHIRDIDKPGRYDISPATFETQLQYLKQWGYTSITIEKLVDALKYSDPLPEKPVIITFDDGDLDIYQNAFPIMQKMGFVGTFYVVSNRLKSVDFVNVAQLREMVAAGWEIGSHSHSHNDMTLNHNSINSEALGSKKELIDAIGAPVNSFAYPFGQIDPVVGNHVASYGYTNGVGLGTSYTHTLGSIFYLSRLEVRNEYSFDAFAHLLPWSPVSTPPAQP
jgi:peptidoglycan/xylan/chitin deacetylase (PgdA/CDA1 family)